MQVIVHYLHIVRKIHEWRIRKLHTKDENPLLAYKFPPMPIEELLYEIRNVYLSKDLGCHDEVISQISQWITFESDVQFCSLFPDGTVQFQQTCFDISKFAGKHLQ